MATEKIEKTLIDPIGSCQIQLQSSHNPDARPGAPLNSVWQTHKIPWWMFGNSWLDVHHHSSVRATLFERRKCVPVPWTCATNELACYDDRVRVKQRHSQRAPSWLGHFCEKSRQASRQAGRRIFGLLMFSSIISKIQLPPLWRNTFIFLWFPHSFPLLILSIILS